MNDDIKKEIEQKAKEFSFKSIYYDKGIMEGYTAGANEFYNKGDKDGYNRALNDVVNILHNKGIICRDHFNPCKGNCNEVYKYQVKCVWDELQQLKIKGE